MKQHSLHTLKRLEEAHTEDARRTLARASAALEQALERYQEARRALRTGRRKGPETSATAATPAQPRPAAAFLLERAMLEGRRRETRRLTDTLNARRRELRRARETVEQTGEALRDHAATRKAIAQRADQVSQRLRSATEVQRGDDDDDRSADRYHRKSRRSGRAANTVDP